MSMSDQDQPAPPAAGPIVPRLVDSYKSNREALHSRVQELVNLRDAIRSAAAQEANTIVDNARRDVRHVLVKARRDLLVLSAQVQAATDDRPKALEDGASTQQERVLAEAARAGLAFEREDFGATQGVLGDARQGIHQILDAVRPDLNALDAEMGLLRAAAGHAAPSGSAQSDDTRDAPLIADFRPDPPDFNTLDLSLSTPPPRVPWFAALPRAAAFVGAFGIVGVIAMIGTTWWRSGPSSTVDASAPPAASPAGAAYAPAAALPASNTPTPVSVRLQAVRDVWLRTTIDGQADAGRLLRAGETRTVSAAGDISVRMGDAGALLVSVNGSDLEPAGRDGEALTRVFSRNAPSRAPMAATSEAPATPSREVARASSRSDLDEPPPIITVDPPLPRTPNPPAAQSLPALPAGGRGGAPAPAANDARNSGAAEGELVPAAQRWFALYHQGEHLTAGGDSPNVTDDRGQGERPQSGSPVMQRMFDEVRVQLVGDNALYTARMTERVQTPNASNQFVSLVSQVWMRRAGMWRLMDVRLVSAGRLAGNTQ